MGFFDHNCALTGVSLKGEDAELFLIREGKEGYAPAGLPIKGTYDRLGSIDGIDETPLVDEQWKAIKKLVKSGLVTVKQADDLEAFLRACGKWEGRVKVGGSPLHFMLVSATMGEAAVEAVESGKKAFPGLSRVALKKLGTPALVERAFAGTEPGPSIVAAILEDGESVEDDLQDALVRIIQLGAWLAAHDKKWDQTPGGDQHYEEEMRAALDEARRAFAGDKKMLAAIENYAGGVSDLLGDDEGDEDDEDDGPNAATKPVPAPATLPGTRSFELVEGTSAKFWEVRVEGDSHVVRFGRIGSEGQTKTKTFAAPGLAQKDADKLIAEKVKKGYVERTQAPSKPPEPVFVPTSKPNRHQLWLVARLEAWFKVFRPSYFAGLRPGVPSSEIEKLEKKIGVVLDPVHRALLEWRNGGQVTDPAAGAFVEYPKSALMGTGEIAKFLEQASGWNRSWVPFIEFGYESFPEIDRVWIVDLEGSFGGALGKKGQVALVDPETKGAELLYPSVEHWLVTFLKGLEELQWPSEPLIQGRSAPHDKRAFGEFMARVNPGYPIPLKGKWTWG
jgi:predicted DNA-binding WGR domain protein